MFYARNKRILCYVVVFDQVDIVRRSLNFLTKSADKLELVVMENPSKNTPKIKKIIDDLGKRGLVNRYYLFDANITNNVFNIVMKVELNKIKKAAYVMITDGDLTSKDREWLQEEINILKHNDNVFACGVSLDLHNLPVQTFPEAKQWIPPDENSYSDFYEANTGAHLLLFRGREFYKFMVWKDKNGYHLVDQDLHRYCKEVLQKKMGSYKKFQGIPPDMGLIC